MVLCEHFRALRSKIYISDSFSLVVSFRFQAEDAVKNFFPDRVFELDKLLKVRSICTSPSEV